MSKNKNKVAISKIILCVILAVGFFSLIVPTQGKEAQAEEPNPSELILKIQETLKQNEKNLKKIELENQIKKLELEKIKLENGIEEEEEPEEENKENKTSKEGSNPLSNLNEHEKRIAKACFELGMSKESVAFVLANANHETGQFKILREVNGKEQARKLGYQGGENWYGRGYIQLTHKNNYEKWSKWTGKDLVGNPDLLITDLELSAHIACSGIKHGSFTGIKGGITSFEGDWYNARALVNGDKNYRAGCKNGHCWTIGTKITDLTNNYIKKLG